MHIPKEIRDEIGIDADFELGGKWTNQQYQTRYALFELNRWIDERFKEAIAKRVYRRWLATVPLCAGLGMLAHVVFGSPLPIILVAIFGAIFGIIPGALIGILNESNKTLRRTIEGVISVRDPLHRHALITSQAANALHALITTYANWRRSCDAQLADFDETINARFLSLIKRAHKATDLSVRQFTTVRAAHDLEGAEQAEGIAFLIDRLDEGADDLRAILGEAQDPEKLLERAANTEDSLRKLGKEMHALEHANNVYTAARARTQKVVNGA
ncbi:MAG: hypothetical protein ABIG71_02475 [Candidatus Uhrbacteria bacterium]